ncbi:PREDICTED: uncharacterized protein LOC105362671 [Ceratosolen solmsi marchali]|uniref:Uncharacterized protein LOC105362671 n=1 Tax=Ceratosolen solmsi marchali TaxID=326594 RepID=A0AAJ6YI36_9HYME|nr:PREDICTED: uncharacterized protein LOC105362671 [Ceratosolen solmsi marchali]
MTDTMYLAKNGDNVEIGTKDLQLLLQQKLGEQVMVLKSTTSSLLPSGENFACSIFEVLVVLKKNTNAPQEQLYLIAKMFPKEDFIKNIFDFSLFFKKEIFFYQRLLPAFQQLEIDFGTKASEIFDLAPKVFGTRYSANSNVKVVDDSTLILMENLKRSGYYTLDKIEGLDLNHSRMAIRTLARFHALGIACKHYRPEFFETEVLAHSKIVPYQNLKNAKNMFDVMFNKLCEDPRIAVHREALGIVLGQKMKSMYFEYVANDPWLSLVHLDAWTNNILYRKDEEGNLHDIKMIDFQNYTYNSPLRDLPYFLCTSTRRDVFAGKLDELLDLYYETFIEVLKKMRCNVEPFNRSSFDKQLNIDCSIEFFHSILAIKFFYAEIDVNTYNSNQLESVIIHSKLTPSGYDKWYDIVTTYIKRGWIQDFL